MKTLAIRKWYFWTAAVMLTACSKTGNFTSQKYTDFKRGHSAVCVSHPSKAAKTPEVLDTPVSAKKEKISNAETQVLVSYVEKVVPVEKNNALASAGQCKSTLYPVVGRESKNLMKAIDKNSLMPSSPPVHTESTSLPLLIILAFILPPVAVYLVKGKITNAFWWNILFCLLSGTLFGYLQVLYCLFVLGTIHALIYIFKYQNP